MKLYCFYIICVWSNSVFAGLLRRIQFPPVPSTHTWVPGANKTIHTLSHTICGIKAFRDACISYDYQDGQCHLEGCGGFNMDDGNGGRVKSSVSYILTNAARNQPAYSISNYPASPPEQVVDDDNCLTDTSCGLQTYSTSNPWWVVDLGTPKMIFAVDLGPCMNTAIGNIEVRVGDDLVTHGNLTATYKLFGEITSMVRTNRYIFFQPGGIQGRFVSLQRMVTSNFYLCDVEVLIREE